MHYYIAGKVQGVWFRASTQTEANALGITGWAKNLPDGRVEVLACGEKSKVDRLHAWLQHGPRRAQISEVICEEIPYQKHDTFEVL